LNTATSAGISERLATLREKEAPTPLWVFLYIYHKAQYNCYIEGMAGARDLAKYLAPITIPAEYDTLATPHLLVNYETQELAKVLAPVLTYNDMKSYLHTHSAIVYTYIYKVLPKLQRGYSNE